MTKYEKVPKELKDLPQWVCAWNNNKMPMKAWERKAASSVNPETWSDFDTAVEAVESGVYDHIGFVFNDNGIVGIDIIEQCLWFEKFKYIHFLASSPPVSVPYLYTSPRKSL